jgi:signal transduction histidine kinase
MTPSEYTSIQSYIGFSAQASALLRGFLPLAEPSFASIVEDFYEAIERHPETRAVITGGPEQIARLKSTLRSWLRSILEGPHDQLYLEQHARIGRVHVRINLPSHFMFTAMNRIRGKLLDLARQRSATEEQQAMMSAINQVLDLELAIMLDTYREDLVERMRVRERLATVGELAATIAHELRNPLGTVESSVFLLRQRTQKLGIEDATLEKHHDRIGDQIEICGKTITNLLELARNRELRKSAIDARSLIESAVNVIASPGGVRVVIQANEGLPLHCDPDQLRRALVNLISNAAEALPEGGKVTISARRVADGVELHVEDDGPGVPDDVRHRIFDVLFTTKLGGTGLGLALCARIVEAHRGEIRLIPSERGAHFRIWLPA